MSDHGQRDQDGLGSLIEDFDRQRQAGRGRRDGRASGEGGGPGGLPTRGVVLAVVVFGCLIGAGVLGARALRSESASLERWSRHRTLIDPQTGQVFVDFPIPDGASYPLENPKTGTRTLVPAEACYWTRDGRAKLEPTWVYVPEGGRVTCPDCGRPVVGRNPQPPVELMLEALDRQQGTTSGRSGN
ncbi:MAG: hypothetical protein KatS3mg103_0124 [Phycisphaerales bacterium]|nr:MAG: hypothetical protein KatS3mg103_0124 [Phycisphaerales bacterium]